MKLLWHPLAVEDRDRVMDYIAADTREIVVHPNCIMVYKADSAGVTILRVLHAAQIWPRPQQRSQGDSKP